MAEKRTIEDEEDKENTEPKKKRLSLTLNKKRFANVPRDKLDKMAEYVMPKNSAASSKWALKNLTDWTITAGTPICVHRKY